jgi:hypothetical protein
MGKAVQGDHDQLARKTRMDGLHVDKVRTIVDELFLTSSRNFIFRIGESISMGESEGNCLITEEALLNAGAWINTNKAVGMNGIPGTAVKELIEKRKDKMMKALNAVNVSGRITAI